MYAYKQQYEYRVGYVTPQKRVTRPVVAPKKKVLKKKKVNPIVEFFRLCITLAFLSAFIIFVFPTAYNCLIKQVFLPECPMINWVIL